MSNVFMTAKEVQDLLGVGRTTAYQVINELNKELLDMGYKIQRGKINRAYFLEKYYYEKN